MIEEKKIAFIICVNNEIYREECLSWIYELNIPRGFQIETIEVRDATSMAAGYNEAMKSTNAKYKIYLHQDVFCVYENMLLEMLECFQDEKIGMIGVLGHTDFLENAMFSQNWNYGRTLVCNGKNLFELNSNTNSKSLQKVKMLDGMFLATQYDIEWDEKHFDGWHFYDISQCMNFYRAGYELAIPYMAECWTIHDAWCCDYSGWDIYRKRFCELNNDLFCYDRVFDSPQEKFIKKTTNIINLINQKRYIDALNTLEGLGLECMEECNTELYQAMIFLQIWLEETKEYGSSNLEYFENLTDFFVLYNNIRFLIWYYEQKKEKRIIEAIAERIKKEEFSIVIIEIIVMNCSIYKEVTMKTILNILHFE